jgi:hypothetical protein
MDDVESGARGIIASVTILSPRSNPSITGRKIPLKRENSPRWLPCSLQRGILYESMNIEFHYYALHYICRCAGFSEEDASTIAFSSQMVDECIASWEIVSDRPVSRTQVTQNYVFWDESVAKDIYLPFHFIPGDVTLAGTRRIDGRAGRFVVTEDSPLAREILIEALKTGNLFRIGIALHAYADTWAHQNFSGDSEAQNAFEVSSPIPAAGHLHALKNPDNPHIVWVDPRLKKGIGQIHNAERFARAASMIYRFLCTYNHQKFSDEIFVVGKLEELWKGTGAAGDNAARASDYIVDFDVPPYESDAWATLAGGVTNSFLQNPPDPYRAGYDRLAWLRNAATKASSALGTVRGTIPEAGFMGSSFASWNKAARSHLKLCQTLFEQRGIK